MVKYMHDPINLYVRLNRLFVSLIGGKDFKLIRSKYIKVHPETSRLAKAKSLLAN